MAAYRGLRLYVYSLWYSVSNLLTRWEHERTDKVRVCAAELTIRLKIRQ